MIVSACAHLMVVLRVKSDLFYQLFLEVILSEDTLFLDPIISYGFAVHSIGNDESHVLVVVREVNGGDGLLSRLVGLSAKNRR